MEYRGYDSAGVAVQSADSLEYVKASGKLDNLQEKLDRQPLQGTVGVGHTRWATHGGPTEENAHPHMSQDGTIAVVHNGIIENYQYLKEELLQEGVVFRSETDSEVIAQLVAKYYKDDLREAVFKTMDRLEGAFGIAVVCSEQPGVLVGARRGSPLVLGVANGESFLASDAATLVGHTNEVIYLKDNDVVQIEANHTEQEGEEGIENLFQISTASQAKVDREIQTVDLDVSDIRKDGYDHFMLKEIMEQPTTIANAMRGRLLLEEGTARLDGLNLVHQELRSIQRIIITACGTSFYAGVVGEYVIENLAGIPVEVEYASEFRYRNPIVDDKTLIFVISQSGETADTLAALREAQSKGATVLGICNSVGSSIARETDGGIYLHAGPEIGVASTKAFTSQVTVLSMLALLLGRMRRMSPTQGINIARELLTIPEKVQSILELNEEIKAIAQEYQGMKNCLYLGRGFSYPVALEGALKLKEISYLHAEGYPAAEMKHGPIALIDEDMPAVFIAPMDGLFEKALSNMQEIKARGGKILLITNSSHPDLKGVVDHTIIIPETLPELTPLLSVIPLQLFSYHIAVLQGRDVDRPRNLAKSVTVE
jgi:glucosamine--fructose-6-phosphate aminotransferase (isomerizing)